MGRGGTPRWTRGRAAGGGDPRRRPPRAASGETSPSATLGRGGGREASVARCRRRAPVDGARGSRQAGAPWGGWAGAGRDRPGRATPGGGGRDGDVRRGVRVVFEPGRTEGGRPAGAHRR